MNLIADTFAKRFAHWKITLAEEDLKDRKSGYIQKAGWLIQYCFGKDQNGEYLDYYATHRMTDDIHRRIYANGKEEDLPAFLSFRKISKDPFEDKKLEDEYYEHNHKVVKLLIDKGFDKFTINMYLHAGMDKKSKSDL